MATSLAQYKVMVWQQLEQRLAEVAKQFEKEGKIGSAKVAAADMRAAKTAVLHTRMQVSLRTGSGYTPPKTAKPAKKAVKGGKAKGKKATPTGGDVPLAE